MSHADSDAIAHRHLEALIKRQMDSLMTYADHRLATRFDPSKKTHEIYLGNYDDHEIMIGNYADPRNITIPSSRIHGDRDASDLITLKESVANFEVGRYLKPIDVALPASGELRINFLDRNVYRVLLRDGDIFRLVNPEIRPKAGTMIIFAKQGTTPAPIIMGDAYSLNSGHWSEFPGTTNILFLTFGTEDGIIDVDIYNRKNTGIPIHTETFNLSITGAVFNYNVLNKAQELGWDGVSYANIILDIGPDAVVGSQTAGSFSLNIPQSLSANIVVTNRGYIVGAGGDGGCQDYTGRNGLAGGPAFYVGSRITLANEGVIGGGGGGGGGWAPWGDGNDPAGGGGAGAIPGKGWPNHDPREANTGSQPGTLTKGGAGGSFPESGWYGAKGGDLGKAGGTSSQSGDWVGSGGAAGAAIVGVANITWASRGTILGSES